MNVGDSAKPPLSVISLPVGVEETKGGVKEADKGSISDLWLPKRGHLRVPAAQLHLKPGQRGHGSAQRVTDQNQLVPRELISGGGDMSQDGGTSVSPRGHESGMDRAVPTARGLRAVWSIPGVVGSVGLRVGRQIDDGVCYRIGAAESHQNASRGRGMGERDITTRIGK